MWVHMQLQTSSFGGAPSSAVHSSAGSTSPEPQASALLPGRTGRRLNVQGCARPCSMTTSGAPASPSGHHPASPRGGV